jgi:hypothetical protein
MAHTEFKPTKGGTRCFVRCPDCDGETVVRSFEVEPALKGDWKFVEIWHLKAVIKCGCGWSGGRSVGTFQVKER